MARETSFSPQTQVRCAEMQLMIQQLQIEKENTSKLVDELKTADRAKDAQIEQLTTWCHHLSTANQTLLQDKAGMLMQAKQATEWCQQLLQANQRLQQEKAQLTEQYNQRVDTNASSESQQREIDELQRQKSVLIQYASEQATRIDLVSQANAKLLAMNQDLEQKLRGQV